MVITFLGTGTSQGVPLIGCDCAVCTSSDPRDTRSRTSIFVRTPECQFVVDTGPDFRAQVLREKIRQLDAVLYTHPHTDHVMGFDDLRRFSEQHANGIPIYASPETMGDLRRVFDFAFSGQNRFPGYVVPDPHEVVEAFHLGATEIIPLPVPHGRILTTGFLFRREGKSLVAYLSDCHSVPDAIAERARGVKHLIIDGLRENPHPTHMSFSEALEAGTRMAAENIWFTHLCHEAGHAATEAKLPPHVRIAYDGLKIEA